MCIGLRLISGIRILANTGSLMDHSLNKVTFLQVTILLFICNWLVHWLWKRKKDPDNYSIPYLTALGDLLGTALLAAAFYVLSLLGDKDDDLGE